MHICLMITNILHKFLSANILSCVINDYIEDNIMVTFTTLEKIIPSNW